MVSFSARSRGKEGISYELELAGTKTGESKLNSPFSPGPFSPFLAAVSGPQLAAQSAVGLSSSFVLVVSVSRVERGGSAFGRKEGSRAETVELS